MAVVLDENGNPDKKDVTPGRSFTQALITDGKGDTLVVSKKGQVMGKKEYQFAGDNRHLLNEYHRQLDSLGDWIIQFDAFDKQDYGFDIVSNKKGIFSDSEYYPYLSANYDLRYKSVETGKSDKVKVDFGSYPKDSVIFKDKYGIKLKFTDKNILSFTGTNQADTNYIYAYHGEQKIGKLMLNVYKRKPIKVCLVMVNGAKHKESFAEIQKHLNKVFKPAVVEFEILHADFKMSELISFSHGGSPWNSVYNDDQKRVLRAYNDSIKDGVYYLFFIDNVTDKKDGNGTMVSGYMPRGYNAGFIYDGGSPHTIAHELGHGIAGLEHVFENSKSSGKTQNLMDYASGEELWHFQWDEIQDPSRVWMKWNKDEEEGEAILPDGICILMFIEKFRRAYVYNEDFITDNFSEKGNVKLLSPINHNIFVRIEAEKTVTKIDRGSYVLFFVDDYQHTNMVDLEKYLYSSKSDYDNSIKLYINEIDSAIKYKNTNVLFCDLSILPEQEYAKLTSTQRFEILKLFSNCSSLTESYLSCIDEEKIVIDLIKYTPKNDIEKLLSYVLNSDIFTKLSYHIDGDNYDKFLAELTKKWVNLYKDRILLVQKDQSLADRKFYWNRSNDNGRYITYKGEYKKGKINFKYWGGDRLDAFMYENLGWGSYHKYYYDTIDAQDIILLHCQTSPEVFFKHVKAGETLIIPGFLFFAMNENFLFDRNVGYIEDVITAISFFMGVGEIATAAQGWKTIEGSRKFWIITNTIFNTANFILTSNAASDFIKDHLGEEKLHWWNIISKALDVRSLKDATMVLDISNAFTEFNAAWAVFRGSYEVKNMTSEDKEIMKEIDQFIKDIEKEVE